MDKNPTEEYISMQKKLVHLCEEGDVATFKRIIQEYIKYLDKLIPFLMKKILKEWNLSEEQLGFGNFVFEIDSQ